jgi:DNA processing protein
MDTSLDLLAWLRFTLAPRLTDKHRDKLLAAFGTPERAFGASRAEVVSVIGDDGAQALAVEPDDRTIERTLEWIAHPNHQFIARGMPAYPERLAQIADPPFALYVQGRFDLLAAPSVAIVGSRNATAQGLRDAEAFAEALSNAGLAVVSGLALGVDSAAHRGGLRGKASSIAVIGTGADRVYPPRNRDLAHDLARNGAIVSEFALGTSPRAGNFPRRNRLISGLARGVLVVEAAMESGSLITARRAAEQGRDVFAIPGSIHTALAKGCHRLIKDGAKLVECAADVLDELRVPRESSDPCGEDEDTGDDLLEAMGRAPISLDEIAQRTGCAAGAIAVRLTHLQIEGRITAMPGGLYQRLARREASASRDAL